MSLEKERFTPEEASRHRHSDGLAELLVDCLAMREEPLYDFGCGDGYYLNEIAKVSTRRLIGIDASVVIKKAWPYIIHPVDAARPITLGPPGDVLCIEVAEHVEGCRLPFLLSNIDRHCSGILVFTWALRGQAGTRHISCRNPDEVHKIVAGLGGFRYCEAATENWRRIAGQDLWWFEKSIYVFTRNANNNHAVLG